MEGTGCGLLGQNRVIHFERLRNVKENCGYVSRTPSSGIWRHLALVKNDVPEEIIAIIINIIKDKESAS
jgi:hypothetical protein